jgi:hypothetical protein
VAEGGHGQEKEGEAAISFHGSIGGKEYKSSNGHEVAASIASANAASANTPVVPVAMAAQKRSPTPTAGIFLGGTSNNVKEKTKTLQTKIVNEHPSQELWKNFVLSLLLEFHQEVIL